MKIFLLLSENRWIYDTKLYDGSAGVVVNNVSKKKKYIYIQSIPNHKKIILVWNSISVSGVFPVLEVSDTCHLEIPYIRIYNHNDYGFPTIILRFSCILL